MSITGVVPLLLLFFRFVLGPLIGSLIMDSISVSDDNANHQIQEPMREESMVAEEASQGCSEPDVKGSPKLAHASPFSNQESPNAVGNEESVDNTPPEGQDYDSSDEDYEEEYIDSLLEKTLEPPAKKIKLDDQTEVSPNTQDKTNDPMTAEEGRNFTETSATSHSLETKRPIVHRYVEPEVTEEGIRVASHVVTKKVVLKKRESDPFEVLPEGWMEATHFSGMPIYLHKLSRVCSVSKPYHLGAGSVRKHDIPLSGIPCLQYKKQIEREQQMLKELQEKDTVQVQIETVADSKKRNWLPFMAVREYCSKLFEFQEVSIRKFKTWADRRAHSMLRRIKERPSLPEGTKLIKVPIIPKPLPAHTVTSTASSDPAVECSSNSATESQAALANDSNHSKVTTKSSTTNNMKAHLQGKKELVLNPTGKSHVCILHEFVQHSQRVQPQYKFKEMENAATPYSATVVVNGMEMGTGYGSSKKIAKSDAAKKTLEILIPDYDFKEGSTGSTISVPDDVSSSFATSRTNNGQDALSSELSFFNGVKITDDRVPDLCNTAAQPGPYQVLVECLKRNHGLGDTDVTFTVTQSNKKKLKNQFTMKVGKHEVTGLCKNSRQGKQTASQLMLQELHPNLTSWGSLLMLYGRGSCKTPKEKREDEKHITELQGSATSHRPNYAILNKLKEEMIKLKERMVCIILCCLNKLFNSSVAFLLYF